MGGDVLVFRAGPNPRRWCSAARLKSCSPPLLVSDPAAGGSVQDALLDEVGATGDAAGSHKTCCYSSSASAVIAVATSLSSPCFSDDVVTNTIGRSIAASQSGAVSVADSNVHGPII